MSKYGQLTNTVLTKIHRIHSHRKYDKINFVWITVKYYIWTFLIFYVTLMWKTWPFVRISHLLCCKSLLCDPLERSNLKLPRHMRRIDSVTQRILFFSQISLVPSLFYQPNNNRVLYRDLLYVCLCSGLSHAWSSVWSLHVKLKHGSRVTESGERNAHLSTDV